MDPNVVETLAIVTAEYDATIANANALKKQMEQLEAKLHPEPVSKSAAKVSATKSKKQ